MTDRRWFGPRIDVRDGMRRDRAALLELLRALRPDDWERPTAAAPWAVRDVVAHVLGDDVGRLARTRDGHEVGAPAPDETPATSLRRLNGEWVRAATRLSPRLLVDLLELTTGQVLDMWDDVDLDAVGEPVSWVSPGPAPVWLDCARDFTEYWVHQQQIREATGRPGGDDPETVRAVVDTFLRAMPHTLGGHAGAALSVSVVDVGRWSWQRRADRWWPTDQEGAGSTSIVVGADVLWRLCVRMTEPEDARELVDASGDDELVAAALQIVSIIR